MGSVFTLLNGDDVLEGPSLSLVCLGPWPEGSHVVEINYNGGVRQRALRTVAGGDEGYEPKGYLFVPDVDWGPSLKRLR